MKKVLLSLFVAIAITVPSFAAKTYNAANRVSTVGSTLLTKNGIPATNVKFTVVSGAVDNSNYCKLLQIQILQQTTQQQQL